MPRRARAQGRRAPVLGALFKRLRGPQSYDDLVRELRARGVRLSKSAIRRYELAERAPDIVGLVALATALRLSPGGVLDAAVYELTHMGDVDPAEVERLAYDLPRQTGRDTTSAPQQKGGVDALQADSSRVQQRQIDALQQQLGDALKSVERLSTQVSAAAAVLCPDREVAGTSAEKAGPRGGRGSQHR